jgi:hypothetical protein
VGLGERSLEEKVILEGRMWLKKTVNGGITVSITSIFVLVSGFADG